MIPYYSYLFALSSFKVIIKDLDIPFVANYLKPFIFLILLTI